MNLSGVSRTRFLRLFRETLLRTSLFAVPLAIDHKALDPTEPIKNATLVFLALLLWIVRLMERVSGDGTEERENRFRLPLLGVLLAMLFSLFFTPNVPRGLDLLALLLSAYTLFHFHGLEMETHKMWGRIHVLLLGVFFFSLAGYIHLLFPSFFGERAATARAWTPMGNPNFAGQYLILAVPWVLLYRPFRGRLWNFAISLWLLAALVFTAARGALLGLVLGLSIALYFRRVRFTLRRIFTPVALILILTAIALATPYFRSKARAGLEGFSYSLRIRRALSTGTVRLIGDSFPSGVGAGGWRIAYPLFRPPESVWNASGSLTVAEAAHNEWLELAAETGLPGLLALFWALSVGFRLARKIRPVQNSENRSSTPRDICFRIPALAGIVATLVQACVSTNFHRAGALSLFAFALAVFGCVFHSRKKEEKSRWTSVLANGFLLALFAVLLTTAMARYQSSVLLWASETAQRRGDIQTALDLVERSRRIRPFDVEPRRRAGILAREAGDFSTAESLFIEGLELEPNSYSLWNLLGVTSLQRENYDLAGMAFSRSVEIVPLLGDSRFYLGRLYGRIGEHEEARRHLQMALAGRGAPLPETHLLLGIALLYLDESVSATEHLRTALDYEVRASEAARYYLALALSRSYREQEALRELEILLDLFPDHPEGRALYDRLTRASVIEPPGGSE